MAKSKNGGSRAFIRGRIGSDVYSVGKDGKGSRQQVVRSLAVQVANPRTQSQMFGRMIMSSVMQAVSALSPIIDHSFDGVAKGQPSISKFIRENYALVKADAIAHPNGSNTFGLVKYQEKGVLQGHYVISDGDASIPAAVTVSGAAMMIALTAGTLTVGGLKTALGLSADGYMTLVAITKADGCKFARLKLDSTLADSTVISASNVGSLFIVEGNATVTFSLNTATVVAAITLAGTNEVAGLIVSDYVNGAWKHNRCVLDGEGYYNYNASTALPTYPTGTEQFLNGGDL